MAFVSSDPRARLAGPSRDTHPVSAYGDASYAKYYETEPQVTSGSERTWIARGQNFVVAYSQVEAGASLERRGEADEYFLLVPDPEAVVQVVTPDQKSDIRGGSVVIVPPGDSTVVSATATVLVRFLTAAAADLAALASNAAVYATGAPNVASLAAWPEPRGGYCVRAYSLDVPDTEGRFGRIWRSRCLMVNYSAPRPGPRDVRRMSPHTHDDFEQGSLCLSGTFVHHLRWPWGTDQRLWREDTHEICAGPSLAVIPPLILHTSQQCGTGINQLVDLFAPPRLDFSAQDGWVLNADEYPGREGE
jgi:quercetin dioxygenase-like cupin family protein